MSKIVKHNGDTIALNRRARHDYHIDETFDAGIVLTGTEVKSLRLGQADIQSAHASIDNNEAYLHGAHIAEYTEAGEHLQHRPTRPRKLLMHRSEINKLVGATEQKGMTLVPMKLYFTPHGRAKIKLGLASGKKQHEKRRDIKERDWKRRKQKIMRQDYRTGKTDS